MSKLDELRRSAGQNVKDSTGTGRSIPLVEAPAAGPPARWKGVTRSKDVVSIPLGMIVRDPDQPREEFDEDALSRLADSLKARGQLQPIRVRWDEGQGKYVVLVGERRWRASQLAGLADLQAVVVEQDLPAEERLMIQLVENALREDLRPVEQARSYRRLMDARGYSTRELAAELHVGQTSVVRTLALLELPVGIQAQVEQGTLAATVAHELTKLPDAASQNELAATIVDQHLTRSEVVEVVRAVRSRRPANARPEPVEIDLGDGVVVMVRYRKPSPLLPQQALRKALKILQDRDREEQAA